MQSSSTPLSVDEFAKLQKEGAIIIDSRPTPEVKKSFILGAYPIPLNSPNYANWISSFLKNKDANIIFVAAPGQEEESVSTVRNLGYTNIKGHLEGGFDAWVKAGQPVHQHKGISVQDLVGKVEQGGKVLDVRTKEEQAQGAIENAQMINFMEIPERFNEVPKDQPVYIHCKLGGRAVLAYAILQAKGYENVVDILGGIGDIEAAGVKLKAPQ